MSAQVLPPTLFELDPEQPVGRTAEQLHEGLDSARTGWEAAGYCTAAVFDHDELGHWTRIHVCTARIGHEGQHKCDRCDRTWGCEHAWRAVHPAYLQHKQHRCVFNTACPHTRHECRCGLNLHDTEAADD